MKNVVLFPPLSKVRRYQIHYSIVLTSVPLICTVGLLALLLFFGQMNLYFLENGGFIVNEALRQAYFDQMQLEVQQVLWFLVLLFVFTFGISYFLMGWAVSPFVNGERLLRRALKSSKDMPEEDFWLSESPAFHRRIWGLAQCLREKNPSIDPNEGVKYRFNYRFFFKFVLSFAAVSVITGFVLGIILNTVYLKIVSLAITLMKMNNNTHFFIAQEQLLRSGVIYMVVLSCFVYAIIGVNVTRYMSNMLFVFSRAVVKSHFPLELRDSDIYHGLAGAISEVADTAGLAKKKA